MKTHWKIVLIVLLAGLAPSPCGADDNLPPALSPQQVLARMRTTSDDAAVNCSYFYDYFCRLQIRSPEADKSLAEVLRLRDVVQGYHDAIAWDYYEPRPEWLRRYCETLLDAWINVELSFPQLEVAPRVVGSWNRAQESLIILYRASLPYIGQPTCPLPLVLGAFAVQPKVTIRELDPKELAVVRSTAHAAAVNCGHFYAYALQSQARGQEADNLIAAILRLRDAARSYHSGVSWGFYAPQSNWLRECSETLLDAWINVELLFPPLEATPQVAVWWNRSQRSLVDLYNAASPYIGPPIAPLPLVLGVKVSDAR